MKENYVTETRFENLEKKLDSSISSLVNSIKEISLTLEKMNTNTVRGDSETEKSILTNVQESLDRRDMEKNKHTRWVIGLAVALGVSVFSGFWYSIQREIDVSKLVVEHEIKDLKIERLKERMQEEQMIFKKLNKE